MGTSKDRLVDEIYNQKEKVKKARAETRRYKKAYNILMDYFDCIPEDERQEVSDRLDKLKL